MSHAISVCIVTEIHFIYQHFSLRNEDIMSHAVSLFLYLTHDILKSNSPQTTAISKSVFWFQKINFEITAV